MERKHGGEREGEGDKEKERDQNMEGGREKERGGSPKTKTEQPFYAKIFAPKQFFSK